MKGLHYFDHNEENRTGLSPKMIKISVNYEFWIEWHMYTYMYWETVNTINATSKLGNKGIDYSN